MFLDISWCIYMQYRWAKNNFYLCWCNNCSFWNISVSCLYKNMRSTYKIVPAVRLSV
jgi:hypothetical protein